MGHAEPPRRGAAVRSLGALGRLAAARARAAPIRWTLPALGSALAVGLLGAATGGGTVAGEAAARQTVRDVPAAQRTVRVSWSGALPPGVAARATQALRSVAPGAQTTSVLYLATDFTRPGASAAGVAQLAAIAPLSRWLRLTAGRFPRGCAPARCEVLDAGGPVPPARLERNGLHLVVVGRGRLTSAAPLGFVPGPTAARSLDAAVSKTLLVSGDPAALGAQTGLFSVFRSWGWTASLDGRRTPSWQLDGLRGRLEQTDDALRRFDPSFSLQAPLGALEQARARASEARRRVVFVGAGAAVLLAAFALLAAGALRRDLDAERRRLLRRGARTWQVEALGVAECAWPATLGALLGAAAALATTALRARGDGLAAGAVVDHALLGEGPALTLLGAIAGVTALGWLGTRAAPDRAGRLVDVAVLAVAGGLAIALSRGDVTPGSGDDTLPALLPPLVCLGGGFVVGRVTGPVLRGLETATRRGPLALRLAALGLARAPGGPALSVAVVAVASGLACFATAYDATLRRGDRAQAAYRVPAEVTVAQDADFTSPLAVAPLARWRALAGPGGRVVPVTRTSATVPRGAVRTEIPLLALPASGLASLHGVRRRDLDATAATLARRLAPRPAVLRGPVVDGGTLSVRARTSADALSLVARFAGDDGGITLLTLGDTGPAARTLRVALPASATGEHLVGLELAPTAGTQATRGHQQAENTPTPAIVATTLTLSDLRLGSRPTSFGGWVGRGAARAVRPAAPPAATPPAPRAASRRRVPPTAAASPPAPSRRQSTAAAPAAGPSTTGAPPSTSPGPGSIALAVRFDRPGRALLGPRQDAELAPLPVLADAVTARSTAPGGLLPISIDGEPTVARVVGTLRRFPTVPADADGALVADDSALRSLEAGIGASLGRADELWVDASDPARLQAALRGGPFGSLPVTARRDVQRRLDEDPLARELARTLLLAALVALGLAALGVALSITAAIRDDGASLFDLETAGVDPRTLRAEVRLRAALLCALGLPAGLAVGAGLLRLTVGAVGLTATGDAAVPPLEAAVPWAAWAGIGGALALAVGLAVGAATHRAFAGSVPRRPAGAVS